MKPMTTLWVIARMSPEGEKQIRYGEDGRAVAFYTRKDAEKYIENEQLGPEAFTFQMEAIQEN